MEIKNNNEEANSNLPVRDSVDVLVVGGGPSGIIGAIAAAESGLKVMLIENRSFVGGNMTIGLPILGFLGQKGNQIIKGIPQKFIDRLKEVNGASEHRPCPLHMSLTLVEPEAVKTIALKMLLEHSVKVLFYAFCADVVMDSDVIKSVVIESKAGREIVNAKVVIDCSGDADVAFKAGVPCDYGDESGGVQPPTLMFCMGNVDTEELRLSITNEPRTYLTDFIPSEYFGQNNQFILVGLRNLMAKAKEDGLNLTTERTIVITGLRKGEAWINMTRVNGVNGTDPESLTKGEIEARRQIEDIILYLTRYVPGFQNSYFLKTAPFLGIRETRRIRGRYTMTKDDILGQRRFDDVIAVASYPIDIHHPVGGGCTLEWSGDSYDIPYRSLIPQGVSNLIVAGRSISSTHEAMSSIRVMATCMAMGEAAGRAAALSINEKIGPSEINISDLQKVLAQRGAYVGTVNKN